MTMKMILDIVLLPLKIALIFVLQYWDVLAEIISAFLPRQWRHRDLSKEVVLVTGAGKGIGRALAITFAKHGSMVILLDSNKKALEETLTKIETNEATSYVCDISKKEEIYKTAELIKRDVGAVTFIINTESITAEKELLHCPDNTIQKTFDVNVVSNFWITKAFLPDMIKNSKGHIVIISNLAGVSGFNYLVDNCSSNHFLEGFEDALHTELRTKKLLNKIHTTFVCSHFFSSEMFDGTKPSFIPFLKPENIVKKMFRAIMAEERFVIIPKFMLPIIYLKRFLPWKVTDCMLKSLASANGAVYDIKKKKEINFGSKYNANANSEIVKTSNE